jgi:hypothetical protein
MSMELVHASVERGLRGGSGFATAAATRGMPAQLEQALADLSAYDFHPTRAIGADRVEWSHRVLTLSGKSHTVLSRIAPCGNDWSGRPNRVAHHLVLEPAERAETGPAAMLAAFESFATEVPAVEERAAQPQLAHGDAVASRATAWEAEGFDPGFAGVLAQIAFEQPQQVCYVVFEREVSALPLLAEVLALIPHERRWMTTFSTRFARARDGTRCQIRCVRAGTEGLARMLAEPGVRVVEIREGASAGDSPAAECARRGVGIGEVARAPLGLRVDPVLMREVQLDERASTRDAPERMPAPGLTTASRPLPATDAVDDGFELSLAADESGASAAGMPAAAAVPVARLLPATSASSTFNSTTSPSSSSPSSAATRGDDSWRSPVVLALVLYSAIALAVSLALFLRVFLL